MFASSEPQGASAYHRQCNAQASLPTMRKWAIALLVCSLIPCTAPFAAVLGVLWLLGNRQAIRTLPPFIGAMGKIAVGVAWVQTLLFIAIAILNTTLNG